MHLTSFFIQFDSSKFPMLKQRELERQSVCYLNKTRMLYFFLTFKNEQRAGLRRLKGQIWPMSPQLTRPKSSPLLFCVPLNVEQAWYPAEPQSTFLLSCVTYMLSSSMLKRKQNFESNMYVFMLAYQNAN